jgi:hypothetical protein
MINNLFSYNEAIGYGGNPVPGISAHADTTILMDEDSILE